MGSADQIEAAGPQAPKLQRIHARRLREVYRSAGWPCLDGVEIELLAAGLLERAQRDGHEIVRVTQAGLEHLAAAAQSNRKRFTAHEELVQKVAQSMLRDGRLVWTNLSLRAWLAPDSEEGKGLWKVCRPDLFSIRNTSVQAYLEPVVHEIKVSRADLLGDLKLTVKRRAYLDVGGQCWYVLGCDALGRPIGEPDEIAPECGVMLWHRGLLEVLRAAPRRACAELPFAVWMALAKATPLAAPEANGADEQSLL